MSKDLVNLAYWDDVFKKYNAPRVESISTGFSGDDCSTINCAVFVAETKSDVAACFAVMIVTPGAIIVTVFPEIVATHWSWYK